MYVSWNDLPIMLDVNLSAKVLGINKTRMYDLTKTPGFPALRIGNRILIHKEGLHRWIVEQEGKKLAM